MKKTPIIASVLACITLVSCEKEHTKPTDDKGTGTPQSAMVLKEGSGFSQSIDIMVKLTEMNTGSVGKLGLYDFNIDNNNQLNLAYYDEWQSQQDKIQTGFRKAFDMSSKAEKEVSGETENPLSRQNYKTGALEFMPYSTKFVSFNYSDWGSAGYSQGFFGGDVSGELPMAPTWQGNYSGGVAYYNVYAEQKLNGGKHFMLVQLISSSSVLAMYEYLTPAMPLLGSVTPERPVLANFPEPRHMEGQGQSVVISVRADSVLAYKINSVMSPAKIYTLKGALTSTGLDKELAYTFKRHYSADGKKMSMLVCEPISGKYWTYTYDFATDVLKAVLNDVDLPYSGAGTDMDMDEEGNVYYSGMAGNGSNANGVSIYKRSQSGVALVGADDFLKFGEIVKLKYINGKVYMVVTGNVTGVNAWAQLSIIHQN